MAHNKEREGHEKVEYNAAFELRNSLKNKEYVAFERLHTYCLGKYLFNSYTNLMIRNISPLFLYDNT